MFFALYIYQKMFGNPAFPNPPVDLSSLKAAVDRLASLIAAASYGDSRVLIERDQVRSEIHIMLRHLRITFMIGRRRSPAVLI